METIKVSVDINVNLSENTKQFLTNLFTCKQSNDTNTETLHNAPSAEEGKRKPEAAGSDTTSREQKSADASTTGAACASTAGAPASKTDATSEKPKAAGTEVTISMVREMVAKKSMNHREALKNKLTEYGATKVGTLDPKYYEEFYEFASNL